MPRNRIDVLKELAGCGDIKTSCCYLCEIIGTSKNIDIVELCSKCHKRFKLLKELEYVVS
jgi:hypothetical protein